MTEIPFEERRARALEAAEDRCRTVWQKCPELNTIDDELSNTGLNIFKAALLPDEKRAS